jgi:hypothetical protein
MKALLLLGLLGIKACEDDKLEYAAFSSHDDVVHVKVGAGYLLEDVSTEILSNTGINVVGEAMVSPGGGPIGTEHMLTATVSEENQYIVDRVSVEISSPHRPERELDLVRDSEDRGLFVLDLVSVGEEGESRTDIFNFKFWDVVDDDDEGPGVQDTSSDEK